MRRGILVVPVAAAVLILGLTGCSRLAASTGANAPVTPSSSSTAVPAPTGSAAAANSSGTGGTSAGSLDSITQDLNAADDAASQAGDNQQSADQAAATSDNG